jgi:hypothetical protein
MTSLSLSEPVTFKLLRSLNNDCCDYVKEPKWTSSIFLILRFSEDLS